jgi:predicted RNA-binding Zn ribbon-like protein
LVQDLVNTVDLEGGDEELGTPEELTAWARARGVGTDELDAADAADGFDAAGLAEVLALREALRDVCSGHAGADIPPDALAGLNERLKRAPLRLVVDATGGATLRPVAGLTGIDALTALVAAAVAASVADGSWPRLKACASDTCRWVYYDRSPAGRSRWCTMAICGSRAKMRTYRRNKAG